MGSDHGLPPSVRLIWRLRDLARRNRRASVLSLLAVALLWTIATGVYTVGNGESAARLRFGSLIHDGLPPGLRYRLPGGVDEIVKLRTSEVLRLSIEGDRRTALDLVTGDENLVEATLSVQYRIAGLGDYLFATESPEELVRQTVRAEMVEAFGVRAVDDVLTSAKAEVEQRVRRRSQQRLDEYASGVLLTSVNLQSVDPPAEAAGAFRDVLDGRAEAAAALSRASAAQDRNLRLARGEAAQLLRRAEAEAHGRGEAARGSRARFEDLLPRYQSSPRLTRTDLYTRAIREVLPQTRVVVLPPGQAPPVDIHLYESESP